MSAHILPLVPASRTVKSQAAPNQRYAYLRALGAFRPFWTPVPKRLLFPAGM